MNRAAVRAAVSLGLLLAAGCSGVDPNAPAVLAIAGNWRWLEMGGQPVTNGSVTFSRSKDYRWTGIVQYSDGASDQVDGKGTYVVSGDTLSITNSRYPYSEPTQYLLHFEGNRLEMRGVLFPLRQVLERK